MSSNKTNEAAAIRSAMDDHPSSRSTKHFCVKLFDENENMIYKNAADFGRALDCPLDASVKVVSIVGNTGDGKSHTLNCAFFEKEEVFPTCKTQSACTLGVSTAYLPSRNLLFLDTEGLLGSSNNPNKQKRLLLKVFAISDVIIYRTMANRLHADMFTFLADASDAFSEHFKKDLERICHSHNLDYLQLGPDVIIFQETKHTIPLEDVNSENESILLEKIRKMDRNVHSFSSLKYLGSQIVYSSTDFGPLNELVFDLCKINTSRSPRKLKHIFNMLANLNEHFSSDLPASDETTFVQEYFTCSAKCLSCQARCSLGLGHEKSESRKHCTDIHGSHPCRYEPSLENKIYMCKKCMSEGRETSLTPKTFGYSDTTVTGVIKYIWHGFVLECQRHGVVYKSRAQWSNNPVPERTAEVDWRVIHLWPGETSPLKGIHTVSQHLIDKINYAAVNISDFAAPHARIVGDYVADFVAPEYWQPNVSITECYCCGKSFNDILASSRPKSGNAAVLDNINDDGGKHHCRACGMGVCDSCSTARMYVPERGYPDTMVRVCDKCFQKRKTNSKRANEAMEMYCQNGGNNEPAARRVVEFISSTQKYIAPFFNVPKEMVKSYARPSYWQPNEECEDCNCCTLQFTHLRPIHHCRKCGKGICDECSKNRVPVPERGIDQPSRVCDLCFLGKDKFKSKRDISQQNNTLNSMNSPTNLVDCVNDQGYTTVALSVPPAKPNNEESHESNAVSSTKEPKAKSQIPGIRTVKSQPSNNSKSGKRVEGSKKLI